MANPGAAGIAVSEDNGLNNARWALLRLCL